MKPTKFLLFAVLISFLFPGVIEAKDKKYKNGDFYSGEWKKGKPDGQGKMTFADGTVYEGQWSDGKIAGNGILTDESGTFEGIFLPIYDNETLVGVKPIKGTSTSSLATMEGEWDNDNVFTGVMTVEDAIFKGVIENNIFKEGRLDLGNGAFIEGTMILTPQFDGNIQNAILQNSYIINQPAIYSGIFKNGKFIGQIQGEQYATQIKNFEIDVNENGDQIGKLTLKDGAEYKGSLKNMKFNGEGELHSRNGMFSGIWKDGVLNEGDIVQTASNSKVYEINVKNGKAYYSFPDGEQMQINGKLDGSDNLSSQIFIRQKEKEEIAKYETEFHKRWKGNFVKFVGKLIENPEEDAKFRAFFGLDSSYFQGLAEITISSNGNAHFQVGVAPTEKAFNQTRQKALQVSMFCEEMNRDVSGKWTIEGNKILIDGKKYGLTISSDNKSIYYSGTLDAKMVIQN